MNTNTQLIAIHDKKIVLSSLWIFVMFCIAYADIIGFLEPGTLQKMINGDVGFTLTPAIMVLISLVQVLPIAMILIARWFRRDVNRWLNMATSVLTLLYVIGGGSWASSSYIVFATLEILALLTIIWLAWTWRSDV